MDTNTLIDATLAAERAHGAAEYAAERGRASIDPRPFDDAAVAAMIDAGVSLMPDVVAGRYLYRWTPVRAAVYSADLDSTPTGGGDNVPTLPRYYSVQAVISPGSHQVPTFFLDANVQGITSLAAAERVARDILTAGWDIGPSVSREVYITVTVAEDMAR